MPVDEYEAARPERRPQMQLILTRQDREEILIEWGATFPQIIDSIRANVRAKNQRRRTVNSIGTYDRWEEVMESAGRKLKRKLLLQKPRDRFQTTVASASSQPPKFVTRDESSQRDGESHGALESDLLVRSASMSDLGDRNAHNFDDAVHVAEHSTLAGTSEISLHTVATDADSRLPAHMIEIDYSDQMDLLLDDDDDRDSLATPFSSGSHCQSDDFELLDRDASFWQLESTNDFPSIRRVNVPMIISEDGGILDPIPDIYYYDRGFIMQPPPMSHTFISRWQ
jgi:hypothetical protein